MSVRLSIFLPVLLAAAFLQIAAQAGRAQTPETSGPAAFTDAFSGDSSLNTRLWTTQSDLLNRVAAAGEGGGQCFSLGNAFVPPILSFGPNGMEMSGTNGWTQFTGIQSVRTFSPPFEFRTTVKATVANGNPFEIFLVTTDGREWFSLYGNVNPSNQPYTGIDLGCELFYGHPAVDEPYTIDISASAAGLFSVSLFSGSTTLATKSFQVGAGPFYLVLGQGEGWPNTGGTRNVALWQSVTVQSGSIAATAPSVKLYAPVTSGTTVSLNGVATTTTPGAAIKQIAWNWGDGSPPLIGQFPETHIYNQSGNYTITVTATDSNGSTGSAQTTARLSASSCGDPFASSAGWSLDWSDEFNSKTVGLPDTSTWNFNLGGGSWGNGEIEVYCGPPGYQKNPKQCPTTFSRSSSNAYIDGKGHLVIQAVDNDGTWTSARMNTDTNPPTAFTYGVVEACMKLPDANGLGPAFWMMGVGDSTNTSWPYIGEIDIAEHWRRAGIVSGIDAAVHGGVVGGAKCENLCEWRPDLSDIGVNFDDFHLYGVKWLPQQVQFFVDNPDKPFATLKPSDLPKGTWKLDDWPFYIILNVAVGGSPLSIWGQVASSASPARMLVDYVRVYKHHPQVLGGPIPSSTPAGNTPSHTISTSGISISPTTMQPPASASQGSLALSVSPASVAEGAQFTVSGTVKNATGGLEAGATIQISASASGSTLPLTTVTTGSHGSFSTVLNAPPVTGSMAITANVEGASPPVQATAPLTVVAGQ